MVGYIKKTHKNPFRAPVSTCHSVWRSMAIRDVPRIPATMIMVQITGIKSNMPSPQLLILHNKPISPPMPAMCALIFQKKLTTRAR